MNDIIEKYIDAAIKHGEATNEGKYRIANKQHSILSTIYKEFEKDVEEVKKILNTLLDNENIYVKSWAAAHALGLNILQKKAEKILTDISRRNDIGISRLNAEMTLKVWRQGKLKF